MMRENDPNHSRVAVYRNRLAFLWVVGLLYAAAAGCVKNHYCGFGFAEEMRISQGWLYTRTVLLNYSDDYRTQATKVDSSYCEAHGWYGAYRDFVRDTTKEYWSVCLYHTGKVLPDTKLIADSVRVSFGEPVRSFDFTPLCPETWIDGYNKVLCIQPIPLPRGYVGQVQIDFLLSIISDKEGVILDRYATRLIGGCYWKREPSEGMRR